MSGPVRYGPEPAREALGAMPGDVLLEFGTDWCGHCIAAWPIVDAVLSRHPDVRHVAVEDGRGRPLGRAFGVKLWPTLVRVRQGAEVARVVRPTDADAVERLFDPLPQA